MRRYAFPTEFVMRDSASVYYGAPTWRLHHVMMNGYPRYLAIPGTQGKPEKEVRQLIDPGANATG